PPRAPRVRDITDFENRFELGTINAPTQKLQVFVVPLAEFIPTQEGLGERFVRLFQGKILWEEYKNIFIRGVR
ncbi:MAG: hypothetical protein AAB595_02945, partial [Patescibacteria group bacterium]